MDRVDFDGSNNIEPGLFKAKAHAPSACKEVNAYWAHLHTTFRNDKSVAATLAHPTSTVKESDHLFQGDCGVPQITLPHDVCLPASRIQSKERFCISRSIGFDFRAPILGAALWKLPPPAAMSVPKTPMHEDRFATAGENQIGRPRQLPLMKPIPIAQTMKGASNDEFRLRVASSDLRHDEGTAFC